MLYKDNVRYELTTADKKAVDDFIGGKYPVRVKYPKSLYTERADKGNPTTRRRKDRPRQVNIPFEELVQGKDSQEKWNYTLLPPIMENNVPVFYRNGAPACKMMTGPWTIAKGETDLLFFLIFKSNILKKKGNETALIEIEDTNREATERNAIRAERVLVESAIYGPQKLHRNEVDRVAKIFAVPMVETLTEDEVRDRLIAAIESRQNDPKSKDGYKAFMELSNNADRNEILIAIQTGKDRGLIQFQHKNKMWYLLDENGKKQAELGGIVANRDFDQALEYHVMQDPSLAKVIKAAVADKVEEPAVTE